MTKQIMPGISEDELKVLMTNRETIHFELLSQVATVSIRKHIAEHLTFLAAIVRANDCESVRVETLEVMAQALMDHANEVAVNGLIAKVLSSSFALFGD